MTATTFSIRGWLATAWTVSFKALQTPGSFPVWVMLLPGRKIMVAGGAHSHWFDSDGADETQWLEYASGVSEDD